MLKRAIIKDHVKIEYKLIKNDCEVILHLKTSDLVPSLELKMWRWFMVTMTAERHLAVIYPVVH